MGKKKLFTHNDIMLNDSLPGLSINSLKQIFPNNFPERDSLISFTPPIMEDTLMAAPISTEKTFTP